MTYRTSSVREAFAAFALTLAGCALAFAVLLVIAVAS